jgi:hypothetical protein
MEVELQLVGYLHAQERPWVADLCRTSFGFVKCDLSTISSGINKPLIRQLDHICLLLFCAASQSGHSLEEKSLKSWSKSIAIATLPSLSPLFDKYAWSNPRLGTNIINI